MAATVLSLSLLLRLIAIGWSVVLLVRERDRWSACLTGIFALMTARLAGAHVLGHGIWQISGFPPLTQLGELAASGLMLATAAFLDRMLTDRDRARLALEQAHHDLERRVEERTADLRESEEKFRQLVDHIDAVFWLGDLENERSLYVSPGFEKLFGRTYEEFGAGSDAWIDAVHADDRERVTRAYQHSFVGGDFDEEFRILRPDGTIRWIRDQGFMVRAGTQPGRIMAGLANDITAAKETEEALRDSNEELEIFAQTISHDLKAPLRAMEAFAVALGEDYGDRLDERARTYLSLIADGAVRMDTLLNDLLQHARLGRSLADDRVDLGAVVTRVLEGLSPQLTERDARVEVSDDLPVVWGHRSLLETAIQNLVTNAVKFVPEDRRPQLSIGIQTDANAHHLFVRDNGIGIEPNHHERIFSIFERLHPREAYPGTGIGLAIVKKAARLHGGDATVESTPGQGSTFWLTLPRRAEEGYRAGDAAA
jgi:PAS domain S-box-containing protein